MGVAVGVGVTVVVTVGVGVTVGVTVGVPVGTLVGVVVGQPAETVGAGVFSGMYVVHDPVMVSHKYGIMPIPK